MAAELGDGVEHACRQADDDGRDQVEAALATVLDWIATKPAAAHVLLIDAPTDPPVEELLIEGVASILQYLVLAGEAKRAPTLLPSLCAFLEQPYLSVPVRARPG